MSDRLITQFDAADAVKYEVWESEDCRPPFYVMRVEVRRGPEPYEDSEMVSVGGDGQDCFDTEAAAYWYAQGLADGERRTDGN